MYPKFFRETRLWPVVITTLACAFASPWAHAQNASAAPSKAPKFDITKPLGEPYVTALNVAVDQARLVIYRPRISDGQAGVVSVYLNDRYHTSLQPYAYTEVCFATTQAQLRSRLVLADETPRPELDTDIALTFKRGETLYLRLSEVNKSRTHMDIRPASAALQDLTHVRQQKHVISRVAEVKPCKQESSLVVAFDAVAEFNPQQALLTADSEKELMQIADKINGRFKNAKSVKVKVLGYANESTEEALNIGLSLERAQAVSAYLIHQGVPKESLAHEVKGSQKNSAALALGLSGRRVDIAVLVEIR